MMPPFAVAFIVFFAVGPLLYLVMISVAATGPALAGLAIGTCALALLGFAMRGTAPLSALACLWLAWVSAVAFLAHALRRAAPDLSNRWIRAGGTIATTMPWFGLATAQMMTQ